MIKNWGSDDSDSDSDIKETSFDLSKLKSKLRRPKIEEKSQSQLKIINNKRPSILERPVQEDKDIITTFTGLKTVFKGQEPRSFDTSLKFYYPNIKDFRDYTEGGLNLPNKPRPWYSFTKTFDVDGVSCVQTISGRQAFDDATLYKPGLMDKFVYDNYVKPYNEIGRQSPFAYPDNYIDTANVCGKEIYEVEDSLEDKKKNKLIELGPHQKFASQFISNHTDFPGILLYHALGSGKSAGMIAIAENIKSTAFVYDYKDKEEKMKVLPGRKIVDKTGREHACTVTIVVPKSSIDQFFKEIVGHFENNINEEPNSFSGSCVIYSEEEASLAEKEGREYTGYRQFYVGRIKKDSKGSIVFKNNQPQYTWAYLNEYNTILQQINEKIEEINERDKQMLSEDPSINKKLVQKHINELIGQKQILESKLSSYKTDLEEKVKNVYFIVSEQTFILRLGQEIGASDVEIEEAVKRQRKEKDPSKVKIPKKYTASSYVLGSSLFYGLDKDGNEKKKTRGSWIGTPPHPDCFHSPYSVLMFDEIHKQTSEEGSMHRRLKNFLYIYARQRSQDPIGLPAMKIVLPTATPIFDNPFQLASIINLLRPRSPFPTEKRIFDEMFIDFKNNTIKNKMLHLYLTSGYISYFRGGLPTSYPYRRNHFKLHTMIGLQITQYIEKLSDDMKHELMADPKFKAEYEKMAKDVLDQVDKSLKTKSSKYPLARAAALCALPEVEKIRNDYYQVEQLASELMALSSNLPLLKTTFEKYSAKLYWIGEKIIESSEKDEGPIFVFSSLIARGLLPLMSYLEARGWSIFTLNDGMKDVSLHNNKNKFGIWGGKGFDFFKKKLGTKETDMEKYRSLLQAKINNDKNSDGSICKVIFGNVAESVSFMQISQIHVCDPWWNEAKMEQIIGRGIRYCSHSKLHENRQYVDVYYHVSILGSYPEINKEIADKLGSIKEKSKENKKNKKKSFKKKKQNEFDIDSDIEEHSEEINDRKNNINDLARSSVEQKTMSTAYLKNELNTQFEILAKQTAIDRELNKYGNISRLEEMILPNIELNIDYKKYTVLYNRKINKYYLYQKEQEQEQERNIKIETETERHRQKQRQKQRPDLIEIKLNYSNPKFNTNFYNNKSWPAVSYDFTRTVVRPEKFTVMKDIYNRNMYSALVYEDLYSEDFENIKNMTFTELHKYAVEHGEEASAWEIANTIRLKNKAIELTIGVYGLETAEQSSVRALQQSIWASLLLRSYKTNKEIDRRKLLEKYLTSEKYMTDKYKLTEKLKEKPKYKNVDIDALPLEKLKDLIKN